MKKGHANRHGSRIQQRLDEYVGPDGFAARQAEMRRLWEEWISPAGFFSNFHRHFKEAQ
jgi:hypothetical protein